MAKENKIMAKENNKKTYVLLVVMVVLTIISYMTTYPHALPFYQRSLFTVMYTTYSIWFNGILTVACIIATVFELRMYRKNGFISNLILFDLNILYFVPGFLMNAVFSTETNFMNYYGAFWVVFTLIGLLLNVITTRKEIRVKMLRSSNYAFYNNIIVIFFSSAILLVSLAYSNFKISVGGLFVLSEVLQNREASADLNIHWLIWYPILCGSMILPIWFTRAFKRRKIWQMILIIISMCAMFTIGSNRIFLFMLFFAIVFCFGEKDDTLLIKGCVAVLAIICIENYLQTGYPVMNVVRRTLITPNGEARFYVDFFSQNDPDWCKQLLERWLASFGLVSKYSSGIPVLIGVNYANGDSNCNTGLIGYSIANFGSLGIVIGPILYGVSMWLLNLIMNKIKSQSMLQTTAIVIALEIINCYGWAEYLILPSFLLLFYILMFLMPGDDIKRTISAGGKND